MRLTADGRLRYSPTDLLVFAESPYASWMDRFALERPEIRPAEPSDEDRLLFEEGLAHEKRYLQSLRDARIDIVEIPQAGDQRWDMTSKEMLNGKAFIYQAALSLGDFAGFADFLEKVPGASALGDWHYVPLDTKLGGHPKPSYLIQLALYAEMLEGAQGRLPEKVGIILRGGVRQDFRTEDVLYFVRSLKLRFLDFMASFNPARAPLPEAGAAHRGWSERAESWLLEVDHLSQVAGIARGQTKKLEEAGIRTLSDLVQTQLARVSKLNDAVYQRLREQATLQKASRGKRVPEFKVLRPDPKDPRRGLAQLPPPTPDDVFFDMEGYPHLEGGLEYLFGVTHEVDSKPAFLAWWAHDRGQEKRAFEGFIDWVTARLRKSFGMHIYHYANYEVSALRRLATRHATKEEEMDDLLRKGIFVDLYKVVREGLRLGTSGYSIKDVESLYREKRSGDVKAAGASVVQYHRWRGSGEPPDPELSPLLGSIRDYNKDDCDSTWQLAGWLWKRQDESKIAWIPPHSAPTSEADERAQARAEAEAETRSLTDGVLARIPADPEARAQDVVRYGVLELLAHVVSFHRRETKPVWWALFERAGMRDEELVEDLDCLGALRWDQKPGVDLKKSKGFGYSFDPEQDTKLGEGSSCYVAHDLSLSCTIETLDREKGHALLKFGPKALATFPAGKPPEILSLLPNENVPANVIEDSIRRVAQKVAAGGSLPSALDDFLHRRAPRVKGHKGGALARPAEVGSAAAARIIPDLEESALVIQGPPGAGKTRTAAHAIVALVRAGRRVGITSNSHKAIMNLLRACGEAAAWTLACVKTKADPEDEFFRKCKGARALKDKKEVRREDLLVGGTAWDFSAPEFAEGFDYLFVDEAGQVSIANLVGMAPSARNLVLMGDPQQLAQPTKGAHPGDSGLSSLEYFMNGAMTVPPERGVFLETTWRLHPDVCRFISGAFYEGRLESEPGTKNRRIQLPKDGGGPITVESGILFVPVPHEGNTQGSEEEAAKIRSLVDALVGRVHTNRNGTPVGALSIKDILIVAPYNLQVRHLQALLGDDARVGSVDKFQGQEAPVVILSMCASSSEGSPRGSEFLFSPNRLNVALSRAQSLAIVVACPELAVGAPGTVEGIKRYNLFARIRQANHA